MASHNQKEEVKVQEQVEAINDKFSERANLYKPSKREEISVEIILWLCYCGLWINHLKRWRVKTSSYEGQCLGKLDIVKKTLRACSLRGGEKTVRRVGCCRRAKKKFGETLTRRARDSWRGVYAWNLGTAVQDEDRGNCCSSLGRIWWGRLQKSRVGN